MCAKTKSSKKSTKKLNTNGVTIRAEHDVAIDTSVIAGGNAENIKVSKFVSETPEAAELKKLFDALEKEILASAKDTETAKLATEKASQLKTEIAKGNDADDGIVAKLVNGIVDLVPGAITTIATMFGQPILAGLVGPVTKIVLDALKPK